MMNDRFWIRPNGSEARYATEADAAIIKGMLARGDAQHDIAAYFGSNSGRICETNTGRRFRRVAAAPADRLPPPGPPAAHVAAAVNIQVVGLAEEFRRSQQRMEQKLDHVMRQLAGFGRRVGLIEEPRTPRITRHKPMEA
jgi:hypothetical protein